jgi:hypothetical protein
LVECPFDRAKGRIFAKLPAWKKPFQMLQRLQDAAQKRHRALACCSSVIFSENRCPLSQIML